MNDQPKKFEVVEKRPNGSGAYSIAGWLVWLGAICIIAIFLVSGESRPMAILLLPYLASAAFVASFFLALAGYIVRAISFLPGYPETHAPNQ